MKNRNELKEYFYRGSSRICIPLMGEDAETIIEAASNIRECPAEVIEWRIDTYKECMNIEKVIEMACKIKKIFQDIPVLATFRTHKEGGNSYIEKNNYIDMLRMIISATDIDMIDIEYFFLNEDELRTLIEEAHSFDVMVIGSNHDFDATPSTEDIYTRLENMYLIGMDISKIAVMPDSKSKVIRLLEATCSINEKYEDIKTITMSMGDTGTISRIIGGKFGNVMTFGAAKVASAPGQIDCIRLRQILDII